MAKLKWVKGIPPDWEAVLHDGGRVLLTKRVPGEWLVWSSHCHDYIGEHHSVAGAKAIAQWYADSIELRGRK